MHLTAAQLERVLTLTQHGHIEATQITVHPYSGAATVTDRDGTAAIINPDGSYGYYRRTMTQEIPHV